MKCNRYKGKKCKVYFLSMLTLAIFLFSSCTNNNDPIYSTSYDSDRNSNRPAAYLNYGEPNDTITKATSLTAVEAKYVFQIENNNDSDYYQVADTSTTGIWDVYQVEVSNLSNNDLNITIYNIDSTVQTTKVCTAGTISYIKFTILSGPLSSRFIKVSSEGNLLEPAYYQLEFSRLYLNEASENNDSLEVATFIRWEDYYYGYITKSTSTGDGDYDFIILYIPPLTLVNWKVTEGYASEIIIDKLLEDGTIDETIDVESDLSYYYNNPTTGPKLLYLRVGGEVESTGGSYLFTMKYLPAY